MFMQKNVDETIEKVKGRLVKWKYLLPKMSYKGRVLIINNLIASALWHRLICVDPSRDLLPRLQSILIDFFWDKMHWVPKSVLYLPKEEGGHGLMHVQSRIAAFRIQFIQRLLNGPVDSSWKFAACVILQGFGGLDFERSLFWLNPQKWTCLNYQSFIGTYSRFGLCLKCRDMTLKSLCIGCSKNLWFMDHAWTCQMRGLSLLSMRYFSMLEF